MIAESIDLRKSLSGELLVSGVGFIGTQPFTAEIDLSLKRNGDEIMDLHCLLIMQGRRIHFNINLHIQLLMGRQTA